MPPEQRRRRGLGTGWWWSAQEAGTLSGIRRPVSAPSERHPFRGVSIVMIAAGDCVGACLVIGPGVW